jgi:hypothetical protein
MSRNFIPAPTPVASNTASKSERDFSSSISPRSRARTLHGSLRVTIEPLSQEPFRIFHLRSVTYSRFVLKPNLQVSNEESANTRATHAASFTFTLPLRRTTAAVRLARAALAPETILDARSISPLRDRFATVLQQFELEKLSNIGSSFVRAPGPCRPGEVSSDCLEILHVVLQCMHDVQQELKINISERRQWP